MSRAITISLVWSSRLLLLLSAVAFAQAPAPLKFMGRQVTIINPGLEDDPGIFPKGPATVCIEGPPQRQCYTAPGDFGAFPKATVVEIEKNKPAILFTADSGGVSGRGVHFAILRPGAGTSLDYLLLPDHPLSDQSQLEFWDDAEISGSKLFVTADALWGRDEGHFGAHRALISVYVFKPLWNPDQDDLFYWLEDRYLTVRNYNLAEVPIDDVLAAEKPEILARLRRVKAEQERPNGKVR